VLTDFIAHCLFPDATQVRHLMDAQVEIGEEAHLHYSETHYHGPHGGVKVVPKAQVTIGRAGLTPEEAVEVIVRGILA
jgi:hypothetical protein